MCMQVYLTCLALDLSHKTKQNKKHNLAHLLSVPASRQALENK